MPRFLLCQADLTPGDKAQDSGLHAFSSTCTLFVNTTDACSLSRLCECQLEVYHAGQHVGSRAVDSCSDKVVSGDSTR